MANERIKKTGESQLLASKKYDAKMARRFSMKLNKGTDADIILRLDTVGPIQSYLKKLILEDIARQYKVYWIGGDRDGELVGIFEDEWDAQKFAKAFHEEHEAEFDPTWGGVGITGPEGEDVEW